MHLKEMNHRSPIRVFERSVQGGLGRGNLGVVTARAGVGKSAFLTCLALDRMLRGERVLHVTTSQTVDHVRDFYEEVFEDLARSANLEEKVLARDQVEHARIIQRLLGGGDFASNLERAMTLLSEHVGFKPDLVVLDGHDLTQATVADVTALKDLASRLDVEVWISLRTPRLVPGQDWHDIPDAVARHGELISVIVLLQPVQDAIRIRLLRDHDNPSPVELTLDLDPNTLLVREA